MSEETREGYDREGYYTREPVKPKPSYPKKMPYLGEPEIPGDSTWRLPDLWQGRSSV